MTRSSTKHTAAIAIAAATVLAGCSSTDNSDSDAGSQAAGYPVTIENTFGETTIESAPERIATLGWNAQDVVYALGETPVGMPRYSYGADENGVMPWVADRFDPEATTLLDAETSIPVEQVAGLAPDVVLAPYEGFDEAIYDQLSAFAPTVAYPDKAWQTTWQDQTTIIGEALGKSDEADKLVEDLTRQLTDTGAAHPEFAGKTISVVSIVPDAGAVSVYMPTDPRVQTLTELGFVNAPGVEKLAESADGKFYSDISVENIGDIDADVVVAFVPDDRTLTSNPAYANLGALGRGTVVPLTDTKVVAGLSQASVLSTPWVLDKITPQLSEAATKAGA
ncbi:iron-siderophore ABC transporter substrate-binding protein [Rhodococcus sp. NPDC058521]|uniref:iron-siderophore ABC transporter substrate-binding protein n=1 Tax=Rhodococcus sp. NPDC058521 TaxID=3346536 RepID=UPI003650CCA8